MCRPLGTACLFHSPARTTGPRVRADRGRIGCLSLGLRERALERSPAITGGDAVLEEATSAERKTDGLHTVDCGHEGCRDFRAVGAELAVPVRPEGRVHDGLAYRHRGLRVGRERHTQWVRPPELRIEAGRTGAGRAGRLRGREVETHVFFVWEAAAVVLILEEA